MKYKVLLIMAMLTIFVVKLNAQIYESINVAKCDSLIRANIGNPDFVIIDVRTSGEYLPSHIKCAINMDYYSPTFNTDLGNLDKTKIYLIYCETGSRSGQTLTTMQSLNFDEVYNMIGGMNQWVPGGYKTISGTSNPIYENVNVVKADSIITANVNDTNFVIIDLRTPSDYAIAHIHNAINIDYNSISFTTTIGNLDSNKTYLIYCSDGTYSDSTLKLMYDLDFWEVYNMSEGLDQWITSGYPVDSITSVISDLPVSGIDFSIYPNPCKDVVNIENNNGNQSFGIDIIDIKGQLVFRKQIDNKVSKKINLSNYPKGIYFIKIQSKNVTDIKKLIIQ